MSRKGTKGEQVLALAVGFIVYGVIYFVLANSVVGDTVSANLVWLFSLACGLVGSFITALAIVKFRR